MMQDGVALFHANHGNLGSSGTYDATRLGAARTLLRKQTAVGGGYLSLVPRYLIVPAEREQASRSSWPPRRASSRPRRRRTRCPVGSGISDSSSSPAGRRGRLSRRRQRQIDTVELGLLEGNVDGPMLEQERSFVVDVQRWKVRHVFAPKFLDWRGVVKQPVT